MTQFNEQVAKARLRLEQEKKSKGNKINGLVKRFRGRNFGA